MVAPHRFTPLLHGLPWAVAFAATIWLMSAGLRSLSLLQIVTLVPGNWLVGFYSQAYYPGWHLVPYAQAGLALFLLLGHAWARFATTLLVAVLLSLHFSPMYAPKHEGLSFYQVRDVSLIAIYILTVVLLWLPSSRRWFQRRNLRSAA